MFCNSSPQTLNNGNMTQRHNFNHQNSKNEPKNMFNLYTNNDKSGSELNNENATITAPQNTQNKENVDGNDTTPSFLNVSYGNNSNILVLQQLLNNNNLNGLIDLVLFNEQQSSTQDVNKQNMSLSEEPLKIDNMHQLKNLIIPDHQQQISLKQSVNKGNVRECNINNDGNDSSKKSHKNKIYKCSECGWSSNYLSSLKRHITKHIDNENDENNEDDEISKYVIRNKDNAMDKKWKCSYCDYSARYQSRLIRHIEKHPKCERCGKRFRTKRELADHLPIHCGKSPFQCNECRKVFAQKTALTYHLLLHCGGNPFKCNECGKRFARKTNLNKHVRIHSGIKPYECTKCGKRFNQKANRKTHMKTCDK